MSRKALVGLLAVVIAAAVAIPALADSGTSAKSASVKGLTTRALAKAKVSLRMARGAKRVAGKAAGAAAAAQIAASAAQAAATGAKGEATQAAGKAASAREVAAGAELKAGEAKAEVGSTRSKSGFAEGAETFSAKEFKKSPQGPAVSLVVPAGSGLVQVWAQATVEEEGAVALFEDGEQVEGQADCAAPEPGDEGGLFASSVPTTELLATPASPGGCATEGAPGPVLFATTTGPHSFELRYAACGCEESNGPVQATFSERRLVVAPLP